MRYADKTVEIYSRRFFRAWSRAGKALIVSGIRKSRIAHMASLARFLFFRNNLLALIAIPVDINSAGAGSSLIR